LVHQIPSLQKCISQIQNCSKAIFKIFEKFEEYKVHAYTADGLVRERERGRGAAGAVSAGAALPFRFPPTRTPPRPGDGFRCAAVHDKITRHGAHVHTARRGLAPAKFFALLRARTAHA